MGSAGADEPPPADAEQLAEADRTGLPVHLVTTNPRTLSFYGRLGFRVFATVGPVPALAPILSLWREPSP